MTEFLEIGRDWKVCGSMLEVEERKKITRPNPAGQVASLFLDNDSLLDIYSSVVISIGDGMAVACLSHVSLFVAV